MRVVQSAQNNIKIFIMAHFIPQSGAMTSSSEFSDEDLTEVCGSQEVAKMLSHDKHDDLRIVGSKPKLHTMFEVPVIKSPQVSYVGIYAQCTDVVCTSFSRDYFCLSKQCRLW